MFGSRVQPGYPRSNPDNLLFGLEIEWNGLNLDGNIPSIFGFSLFLENEGTERTHFNAVSSASAYAPGARGDSVVVAAALAPAQPRPQRSP